jgi:hypothetical protein
MEKGMKAQLKVDGGDVDIPSIPGISAAIREDVYPVRWTNATWIILLTCIVVGCLVPFLVFWMTRKEQAE